MRKALLLAALCSASLLAAIPTPREHFGFSPGDDEKLADYSQISSYFQKLASSSGRIRLIEFGKTSLGRPMYAAFISSSENLKRLDEYGEINRKLALGQVDNAEAHRLALRGKVFVWIDSGLHATEVAPSQQAPELAYRMLTGETPEIRRIRENVILIQIPCINPDGLDMVANWYRGNAGTPYELAPLPWLFQKYSGHDNNRDWFMLNLPETRNTAKLLFHDWFPEIVYDQHQAPPFPARIFVPPYGEPLNPNIPAAVMDGINEIGSAIAERLAREGKSGALSYMGFDAWWDGGLRSAPAFHNMHGILTETAGTTFATPRAYNEATFKAHFENGIPTREPSVFYPLPWHGGVWRLRDAIDYMLTADFAILDLAASRAPEYLYKSYALAEQEIHAGLAGKPFAYVIPTEQSDPGSAREMLVRLQLGGIQVERANEAFSAGGRSYAPGTFVLPAAQPFRGYLLDLMEPRKYPEIRSSPKGPVKQPYDIAGWTLPFDMGVQVERVDDPLTLRLEPVDALAPLPPSRDHREDSFFTTMATLLDNGKQVRWAADGALLVDGDAPAEEFARAPIRVHNPRVAVYESWIPDDDAGWTEWLLDRYRIPYAALHNADVAKGDLHARYDAIVLPSQAAATILYGIRQGERMSGRAPGDMGQQRPEFTGGVELDGLYQLRQFVADGGWLIAFDEAGEVPAEHFPLPVRLLVQPGAPAGAGDYYCPGSVLRITADTRNPIAFGMPREAYAFSSGGQAYDVTLLPEYNKGDREVDVVARYAKHDVLASGYLSGAAQVSGKPILVDARFGKGHVLLFGFRPQFRGQTFGTFRLVLNSVYLASADRAQ